MTRAGHRHGPGYRLHHVRVAVATAMLVISGCGSSPSREAATTGGSGSGGSASGGSGTGGSASGGTSGVTLTDEEMARARMLSSLPASPPPDTTNRVADDAAAAALGQRLFFERRFSGKLATGDDGGNGGLGPVGSEGRIACVSCHGAMAMDDDRSRPSNVSLGADYLTRNAPALVNSSYYQWTNWAGRFSAQWELPIAVVENPRNMNGTRLGVAHLIFDKYRADYEAIFGPMEPALGADPARFPAAGKPKAAGAADGAWELMTAADREVVNVILVNFGKVLEAYVRKLVSGGSRFDSWVAGDGAVLTPSEVRGLKLFVGDAHCADCHSGPLLSDNQFHNLGLAQSGPHVPAMDNGRLPDLTALLASAFNGAGIYSDDRNTGKLDLPAPDAAITTGQFRTPSLRNVALTAPYMHAGQLATLADVVTYYDEAGTHTPAAGTLDAKLPASLHLTVEQKADLVAFLGTLTGAPIAPALLADTSAP